MYIKIVRVCILYTGLVGHLSVCGGVVKYCSRKRKIAQSIYIIYYIYIYYGKKCLHFRGKKDVLKQGPKERLFSTFDKFEECKV